MLKKTLIKVVKLNKKYFVIVDIDQNTKNLSTCLVICVQGLLWFDIRGPKKFKHVLQSFINVEHSMIQSTKIWNFSKIDRF